MYSGILRHERYQFQTVKRFYIPKKSGKLRPLGMPPWSDRLVGEVVRLPLEADYEPQFSGRSNGFRPGRGCYTALGEIQRTWAGTTWFVAGDVSDWFGSFDYEIVAAPTGDHRRPALSRIACSCGDRPGQRCVRTSGPAGMGWLLARRGRACLAGGL
jgi:reverse transcriptase-like protein